MLHSAIMEYDINKLKESGEKDPMSKLDRNGYEEFLQRNELSKTDISRRQYLDLVALDDWGTLLGLIPGLLMEYGPRLFNYITDYYKKEKKPTITGLLKSGAKNVFDSYTLPKKQDTTLEPAFMGGKPSVNIPGITNSGL